MTGPAGPAGGTNLRVVESPDDTISCAADEVLVSALCKEGGGSAVMQGGAAKCGAPVGVVGLCMRR
jgi:hypothetical protein